MSPASQGNRASRHRSSLRRAACSSSDSAAAPHVSRSTRVSIPERRFTVQAFHASVVKSLAVQLRPELSSSSAGWPATSWAAAVSAAARWAITSRFHQPARGAGLRPRYRARRTGSCDPAAGARHARCRPGLLGSIVTCSRRLPARFAGGLYSRRHARPGGSRQVPRHAHGTRGGRRDRARMAACAPRRRDRACCRWPTAARARSTSLAPTDGRATARDASGRRAAGRSGRGRVRAADAETGR